VNIKDGTLRGLDAWRLGSFKDRSLEGEKLRVEWMIRFNQLIGLIVVSK
jgi:hypothetical protein